MDFHLAAFTDYRNISQVCDGSRVGMQLLPFKLEHFRSVFVLQNRRKIFISKILCEHISSYNNILVNLMTVTFSRVLPHQIYIELISRSLTIFRSINQVVYHTKLLRRPFF